ncbi:MAG: PAS domain-containing protein [Candidatus Nealsonbacteria bacterium]|nr:PAS domain-containing protein [Candidatus Nealsonbacteria bacterium]
MEMETFSIFDYIHYLYMIGLTLVFLIILLKFKSIVGKLKKTKEQLEEAKGVLEIKVRARTRELSELAEKQEEVIQQRTKKIEEEKNKTLSIVANFSDGLLVFNEKERIFLINPRAEKFLKIKSADIINKSPAELAGFPPIEPLIKILGQSAKEIFRQELAMGKDLVLEVSKISLFNKKEKIGSLVTLHDITREKKIEAMKTEFVSLAAHQLRTPLSAIKWTVLMFLEGDLGKITAEQRSFLERTYISNERMISLINDLLNVARIEEGKYLYNLAVTDIAPMLESEIGSYKEESRKRGVKIIFEKPKDKLPKVMVEVEKIKLVIRNLVDNAIKYTNTGGSVNIFARTVGRKIEVSIKDTGIGIPEDEQNRVFGKFFRGFKPIRMETVGSGLGLFLAKNIIEAHGGKIWFDSKEGEGTTFYFTLPAAEEFAEFLKKF